MNPKASVIIPTYNGAAKIGPLLECLAKQTCSEFELIVVVDGSTDNTVEVLEKFESRFQLFVPVVQPNGGRARARNAGVKVAASSLLIFFDDDLRPGIDNIEKHIQFQETNPEAILVANLSLAPSHEDFHQFRMSVEARSKRNIRGGDLVEISFSNFSFTSANMSITKDVLETIGELDPRLTDSEDLDFCIRALTLNKKVFLDRNLTIDHVDTLGITQQVKRQTEYARARNVLWKIHPEYNNIMPSIFDWRKPNWKDIPKKLILRNYNAWLQRFQSKVFFLLPRRVRYFLYDAFVHVHSVAQVRSKLEKI